MTRTRFCAVVIGGGLMYLAAAHMDAFGAAIAAPRSEFRPARSIPVRHTQIGSQFSMPQTGDDDFNAMMRQQFAPAQAQMEAAMREMQHGFKQIPASRFEHRSFTSRQVFRGQERDDDDDDDDDDTQGQHYPPPAPQLVTPPPASASSPDDVGWWNCIIGLFAIAFTVGIAVRCIHFACGFFGPGAVTKAPMFAASGHAYQPSAWPPPQPPSPAQPAWSAKPAGPVIYDIPE